MGLEIEATFIDIDKDTLRKQLKALGGELKQPETLMRRVIFDRGQNAFVRVRDEGNCITMSYKNVQELSLTGMQEICLEVNNYEQAIDFLRACGLKPKAEQETLREEWVLDGVEIDIDTWPWLPSFVEIEGKSPEAVRNIADKLGFDMGEAHYGSVDEIYKIYYDVTNEQINFCPEIKFTNPPEWLVAKQNKPYYS